MDPPQTNKPLLHNLQQMQQEQHQQHRISTTTSIFAGEHHFDSYVEYILSMVGFAVGFGSFWRFPYLVYKNGGGAFLIPYFTAIFVLGIPLLYLQTVTGQMHQLSAPFIYARINKGFKMLGITFLCLCFHMSGYYNIIMTYSYRFIFSSFSSPLPFAEQSPFESDYFTKNILNSSSGISEFGQIQPFLFGIYIFSIVVCFMIVKKGVKTSGKVIIYTALTPYALFIVLAIRGAFLDGALDGVKYLLVPDFNKLFAIEIWVDAIVQVFYQVSVGVSTIISLSSLKPKKQKHLAGLYIIPLSIISCGVLCALNVFMYLGHFCKAQNVDIRDLTLSGPELSFNIFPKALAILPFPNLLTFLFFTTMVFLGIDTEFGYFQTVFCYLKDEVKASVNGKIKVLGKYIDPQTIKVIFLCCVLCFTPLMTSSAGIYYLQFFDRFTVTIPLSVGALLNYIFFVKVIKFEQLEKQSRKYSDQEAPRWVRNLLEGRIVLLVLLFNVILAFVNQFFYFFKYNLTFYAFGWFLTSYPYILAYLYFRKHRQPTIRTTFSQLKQIKLSQL